MRTATCRAAISLMVAALAVLLLGMRTACATAAGGSSEPRPLAARGDAPGPIAPPDTAEQPVIIPDSVVHYDDGEVLAHGRSLLHGCHQRKYATARSASSCSDQQPPPLLSTACSKVFICDWHTSSRSRPQQPVHMEC